MITISIQISIIFPKSVKDGIVEYCSFYVDCGMLYTIIKIFFKK